MIRAIKKMIPVHIKESIKKEVKIIANRGNKYICPFCNYKSKALASIGADFPVLFEKDIIGAGKRDAGCYRCGSTDRERLIYLFLKDKIQILNNHSNIKVLHLAPEKNLSKALLDSGFEEYVCGDLFTPGYSYPEYVKNMNVLDIPFEDNYFDLIICNHLLEHVPNDSDGMKELYRVLKPGAFSILQVPISSKLAKTYEDFSVTNPKEREKIFGQFDHVRIYGQDYPDRLSAIGFTVERINITQEFEKFGVNEKEEIFIARK